ncbi:MAG: 3-dehydroquinate synthase [Bacillales bacterium]|jgi:3-dehydroquinate synthase|nr:3-dehydroquinate synthase [Bacillales bacterium]
MAKITVHTNSKQYPVYIGNNGVEELFSFVKSTQNINNPILIFTDKNIPLSYLELIKIKLEDAGFIIHLQTVPAGERAKQFDIYQSCLTSCIQLELNRKSLIIALGGGVVGDLAGFVAATYLRGIRFIQVPTTLLAHDSAIGGKVAINHPLGKNLVGAFHQPEAVFFHLPFLKTLPEREWLSGFAEIFKEAMLADVELLEYLMENISSIHQIHENQLEDMISSCIQIKAKIISDDEQENNVRAYLNLGHTLGHAIEGAQETDLRSHGECVAIGILFALKLSVEITGLDFDVQKFEKWLYNFGYLNIQQNEFTKQDLIGFLKRDKKVQDGKVKFVLLRKIGKPVIKEIEFDYLEEKIGEFLDEIRLFKLQPKL